MNTTKQTIDKQREFFKTHKTKNVGIRKKQLKKLKSVLQNNEERLFEAIKKDFGKSKHDTLVTELLVLYAELDYYIKNLKKLAKPKRVRTNLVNLPGKSRIYFDPMGCSLVIGAWNYPYQLSLGPAIAALAAGNCCILKPSEVAENTMNVMEGLINPNFPADYFHVITGGVEKTTEILKHRFDKIFFTGSPRVGKIIYKAAAEHLTPVTLELGGKSPAVITESANLKVAAKRIVWGKFLNAGQTCIAPDYLLVQSKIAEDFIEELKKYISKFDYNSNSSHYARIIKASHFERLISLIQQDKCVMGGDHNKNKLFIEPTVLFPMNWNDKVMEEEIFGPILPVLVFSDFEEVVNEINAREKPLSAYIFSSDSEEIALFKNKISFGGGCVNDTVMHISNLHLPFGGIGNSGIGNYHGVYGFETFSHKKSILNKKTWGEPNLKYPPYSQNKLKWIKRFF